MSIHQTRIQVDKQNQNHQKLLNDLKQTFNRKTSQEQTEKQSKLEQGNQPDEFALANFKRNQEQKARRLNLRMIQLRYDPNQNQSPMLSHEDGEETFNKLTGQKNGSGLLQQKAMHLLRNLRNRRQQKENIAGQVQIDNQQELEAQATRVSSISHQNDQTQEAQADNPLHKVKVAPKKQFEILGTESSHGQIEQELKTLLKGADNPTHRYLLVNEALHLCKQDPELSERIKKFFDAHWKRHGEEVSAKVNSATQAAEFGKNNVKKTTLFSNTFYDLIKTKNFSGILDLMFECIDRTDFEDFTNLIKPAFVALQQGRLLPCLLRGNEHDVISFMDKRAKVLSFLDQIDDMNKKMHRFNDAFSKVPAGAKPDLFGNFNLKNLVPNVFAKSKESFAQSSPVKTLNSPLAHTSNGANISNQTTQESHANDLPKGNTPLA